MNQDLVERLFVDCAPANRYQEFAVKEFICTIPMAKTPIADRINNALESGGGKIYEGQDGCGCELSASAGGSVIIAGCDSFDSRMLQESESVQSVHKLELPQRIPGYSFLILREIVVFPPA